MFKNVIRTIVIALSVIIQVAFYYFVVNLVDYRPLVSLFAKALAIILALIIYRSNRNSSFKIAWLIFIFSVPICGLVFYIFFGHGTTLPIRKTKIISKYLEDKVEKGEDISVLDNDPTAKRLASMLKNTTGLPLYQGTQVTYFKSGEDTYPKLLEELEKAKKFIFIEFFIIARGGMWRSVCDILERKALSGVEVKVIYDDIGTAGRLKEKDVERLNKIPNFTIVPYNPMGYNFSLSLNYRDHRKIVVIDDVVAFTGGFNIGDEYIQQQKRFGYWRDTAIKLVGDAVYSFIVLFAQDWFICTKQIINTIDYSSIESSPNDGFVFPFGDGPTNAENPMYKLFGSLLGAATKYVYISTPYFIIDKEFIGMVELACKSGVEVNILVPHIPDKKFVFFTTRAHYGDILRAGGKIYEFTPGFNHAKNFIVDDKYAFCGTTNCDYRSLYLHFECGSLLINNACIKDMKEDFEKALSVSEEITMEKWKKRKYKIMEFFAYLIAPLL